MSSLVVSREPEIPVPVMPEEHARYAGLATRVISFAIDAALIDLVAIIVGIGAALIAAVLHLPKSWHSVGAVIGAVVYILWTLAYFISFWSGTGQTPGARAMQIRVVTTSGVPIKPRRALLRCVGVVLAVLPLFAGFLGVLFDGRRRAFQDRLAKTLVIEDGQPSLAAAARARKRAATGDTSPRSAG